MPQERAMLEPRWTAFQAWLETVDDVTRPLVMSWQDLLHVIIPYIELVTRLEVSSELTRKRVQASAPRRFTWNIPRLHNCLRNGESS
jgi:hypothetical protein